MGRFLLQAFPAVARELKGWRQLAVACPDPRLRQMALASIGGKTFHCQGGSVFSAWTGAHRRELVQAIVALQTISDYLDNLCDRAGVQDEAGFRRLHQAFLDALRPEVPPGDYYDRYPYRDDGGYLERLVRTCQRALAALPAYPPVMEEAGRLAALYCNLQVYKHIDWSLREKCLTGWLNPLLAGFPERLYWWELAAATGSTLGIFALFALAARGGFGATDVHRITGAYFPWIGGLHILLDYFIDQQEDRQGGDLNFVSYYRDGEQAAGRLGLFLSRSLELSAGLPDPYFHRTVVQGLLAMYLSDPKVAAQGLGETGRLLLQGGDRGARGLFRLCACLRRAGVV
ncbi:hypothetical protein A6M21_06615 [Desulfotomaculum copahuensis]|uniref:Tetraprenyl-beta-curcumene synthase n=2 Tax=Desulfotomaculum copahuensis TaxID=1838280 RepID=A0A1B7LGR8_9FIRM|nr:hypothetical protein A6M21_06615 [Desulfotomaculum copahuensis]